MLTSRRTAQRSCLRSAAMLSAVSTGMKAISFSHAVRVVRRKLPLFAALSPAGQARPA
jgi:hypothetical protein